MQLDSRAFLHRRVRDGFLTLTPANHPLLPWALSPPGLVLQRVTTSRWWAIPLRPLRSRLERRHARRERLYGGRSARERADLREMDVKERVDRLPREPVRLFSVVQPVVRMSNRGIAYAVPTPGAPQNAGNPANLMRSVLPIPTPRPSDALKNELSSFPKDEQFISTIGNVATERPEAPALHRLTPSRGQT